MAMRPRRGSVLQPRPSQRPTYENFKPRSEWKYEDDATILLVYLPGFLKEQIRTEIDESSGLMKIHGQRPLAGGRWTFFSQNFITPFTCDFTKMKTQFELGILTIVMPKKPMFIYTSQNQIAAEAETNQQQQPPPPPPPPPLPTTTTTQKLLDQERVEPTTVVDDKKTDDGIPDEKPKHEPEKPEKPENDENVAKNDAQTVPGLLVGEKQSNDDQRRRGDDDGGDGGKKEYHREGIIPEKLTEAETHDHLLNIKHKNGGGDGDGDGGKKEYHREGVIPEKLKEAETHDHLLNIKHKNGGGGENETVKISEGQALLNLVSAVLVLMGLGAHISSTIF